MHKLYSTKHFEYNNNYNVNRMVFILKNLSFKNNNLSDKRDILKKCLFSLLLTLSLKKNIFF